MSTYLTRCHSEEPEVAHFRQILCFGESVSPKFDLRKEEASLLLLLLLLLLRSSIGGRVAYVTVFNSSTTRVATFRLQGVEANQLLTFR